MPGGVVLAASDRPMCAKLLSADGPADASSVARASLRRGLEALAGRKAGRCGGCVSAAQAATQAHRTSRTRMLVSSPIRALTHIYLSEEAARHVVALADSIVSILEYWRPDSTSGNTFLGEGPLDVS